MFLIKWLLYAGQSLNTRFLSPYLDSLGSNFHNGANFAIVGSCTLPEYKPFNLNVQVMQFLHFKKRSLELASTGASLLPSMKLMKSQ